MKLKNVSFFELHFEKLVMGFAVLVLLAAGWIYGLNNPNKATIDNQPRDPDTVDQYILDKAKSLQAKVESDDVPEELTNLKLFDYGQKFRVAVEEPAYPFQAFNLPMSRLAIIGGGPIATLDRKPFVVPELPAPTLLAYEARLASLDPQEVTDESYPGLVKRFVSSPLMDTPYVSIVGEWDIQAVVRELSKSDASGQSRSIDPGYFGLFHVLDVQVQRQSPRPDGTWADPADADFKDSVSIVDPTPSLEPVLGNLYDPRKIPDPITRDLANAYVSTLGQQSTYMEILQPSFPPTLVEQWSPPLTPDELAARAEQKGELQQVEQVLRELEAKMQGLNRRMERSNKPRGAPRSLPSPQADFGPGGGGATPRTTPTPTGPSAQSQKQAEQIRKQVDDVQKEIEIQQREYQRLSGGRLELNLGSYSGGGFPSGFPGIPGGQERPGAPPFSPPGFPSPGGFPTPGNTRPPRQNRAGGLPGGFPGGPGFGDFGGGARANLTGLLAQQEPVEIHAHDLDVVPGQQYRYRLRLRVTNLLYFLPLPDEQKQQHEGKFLVETDWTDWSQTVSVPRLTGYFVMNASQRPDPGQADVEVWRFTAGLWHTETFKLKPNDPVGALKKLDLPHIDDRPVEVDFFTGAYALDFEFDFKISAGSRSKNVPRVHFSDHQNMVTRRADTDKESSERKRLLDEQARLQRGGGGNFAGF